ncbi:uncharacterized protein LOC122388596 [Amphibalanus amphitrite]|uniref:uncharacterized protein LOC122388596 n=1 Tax=Amphibalanus amphitrite TaxID=1232801 RepID=UPI001C91A3A8|nr:uncharacterized protein LOC122388596 [Amphibalanus amphitrite]
MTVSRKKTEKDKEQTKQDVEVSVKGIKQPELPVFEGVIAKFEDWEVVFDAFIGTSRIDPKLKMLYLKNSLSGEALKLVEGYKPSEMGYAKAREALTDKYGGKTRRIRHGLNDIRQFSNIAEGDTRRLEQYADKVELAPDDRKYHRVLWRNMKDEEPTVYESNRWLFGNAAAPFVAQFVLKENAKKHASAFPLGSEVLLKHFYMDDGIQSFRTEHEAVKAREQVSTILEDGGMKIKKWMSNNASVLKAIPIEDRAVSSQHFFEDQGSVPTKTLGVVWSADEDHLSIDTSKRGGLCGELTKRACLREMASVFDPLGLFVPLTIRAKMLFQQTWNSGVDWDDALPSDQQLKWREWFKDILQLSSLSVPRCIHPFPDATLQEIHVFCDASEKAYGTAIYVVSECEGKRASQLALARARVAPRGKIQTIPRLELMGALLGLRLVKTLCTAMNKTLEEVHFWSDSMDVLCWIRNEVRRFQPFVAHRISEICEVTSPEQWQHVSGTDNPADAPTRGLSFSELKESRLWMEGPKFLLEDSNEWPPKKNFQAEQFDKSEFKKDQKSTFAVRAPSGPSCRLLNPEDFSSWTRLLRVTAWVRRFVKVLRRETANRTQLDKELKPEEILEAEKFWVRQAQKDSFPEEREQLERAATTGTTARKACRRSSVKQLSPFLDEDGVIRVGGRLQRSDLSFETKHPMLLPKNHIISKLVIQHLHVKAEHGMGIEHTLADLRMRFWIPAAREMIKSCSRKCVTCQKLTNKPEEQEMAPLTTSQVQSGGLRAFEVCAVDYAGPFRTKQGRGKVRQKRYLCIFVCLRTKAVHLEMAYSLDTASFLRALMRFMSRRGCPAEIRSDNGRNFVRAAKELKKEVQELDAVSSDPNDRPPLTPGDFITGPSRVEMAPSAGNEGCSLRQRWRRLQQLNTEFWRRWLREYLPTLQISPA